MKELQEIFKKPTISKIKFLVKYLFPNVQAAQEITTKQSEIVKKVAIDKNSRISISAYTRYGKTQTVAIAVAIYILINQNKKIKFIGPDTERAGLIKDYMSELILNSRNGILLNLAEIQARGAQRIKAEASQTRMTFTNGCEYRVVTAHGKGFAAMGHGGDLIVIDEAAEISKEAYNKITRMLGDDPENSSLVELFNPWDRNTKAFEHSISNRFERIKIDWKIGVAEGRTTQAYIQERYEDLDPISFQVLYNSEFPNESVNSLHNLRNIERAEGINFQFQKKVDLLFQKLQSQRADHEKVDEELNYYKYIISCDPADMGPDWTVITMGLEYKNKYYEPYYIYSESQSDPMNIVGRILQLCKGLNSKISVLIKVDSIGLGKGPVSRLKEIIDEKGYNMKVVSCDYGKKAINNEEFRNKKAENNFRLRDLLREGKVSFYYLKGFKEYQSLKTELLSMKKKITSTEVWKIEDPDDKSPDYNDSMVYFVWKDSERMQFDFITM